MQLYFLRLAMLLFWMLLGAIIGLAWHGAAWQVFVVVGIGLDAVTWRYAEWDGVYTS